LQQRLNVPGDVFIVVYLCPPHIIIVNYNLFVENTTRLYICAYATYTFTQTRIHIYIIFHIYKIIPSDIATITFKRLLTVIYHILIKMITNNAYFHIYINTDIKKQNKKKPKTSLDLTSRKII
jgi:hypothetical protein